MEPKRIVFTEPAARAIQREVRTKRTVGPWQNLARRRWDILGVGGGTTHPAVTTQVIPARSDTAPGGPITVTRKKKTGADEWEDGDQVEVYSWVQSDSADPANEPGGELWIAIAKDATGTWWFVGQDCTESPAGVYNAQASADLVVTQAWQQIPGTDMIMPDYGIFMWSLAAEISVTGIPGNQSWDLVLELYDVTNGATLYSVDWAGAGDPPMNPRTNVTWAINADGTLDGATVYLRVQRATTTGTVTIIAAGTAHQMMGPVK